MVYGYLVSIGGSLAGRERIPFMLDMKKKKEKFQTIGETYAKVPWSGKDRACKTLGECTLDQNMGGEKGSSQSLSSAGQGSGKAELMD